MTLSWAVHLLGFGASFDECLPQTQSLLKCQQAVARKPVDPYRSLDSWAVSARLSDPRRTTIGAELLTAGRLTRGRTLDTNLPEMSITSVTYSYGFQQLELISAS